MDTSEMYRLKAMLDEAHIRYEFTDETDPNYGIWLDLKIPSRDLFILGWRGFSVVFNKFSYGHERGLLELWRRPEETAPRGYMTAEEIFLEIKYSGIYDEFVKRYKEKIGEV